MKKKTARQSLIEVFEQIRPDADRWLAVHEFPINDHSQNALATMVSTMARDGLAVCRRREGKAFKEWRPAPTVTVKQSAPYSEEDALYNHMADSGNVE